MIWKQGDFGPRVDRRMKKNYREAEIEGSRQIITLELIKWNELRGRRHNCVDTAFMHLTIFAINEFTFNYSMYLSVLK